MGRVLVSLAMLALGIAFGATAFAMPGASAGPDAVRKGGVFHISLRLLDSVDPALAYFGPSWELLEATCAKLMNYPDQNAPAGLRAVPEVAADYPTISRDGRVYTFRIRPGFRFNTGAKLTARSFQRAIERLADPAMRSPAVTDATYVEDFVGADRVLNGQTSTLSGVVVRGNTLRITLKRRVPDFTARLAMPFFCAVPPSLPANPEGVAAYPSAGPYYVAEYLPGRRVTLRRNPHYDGNRPHRIDRFEVEFTSTPTEVIDRIEAGAADWGWIHTPAWAARGEELMRRYRRSPSRLRIRPSPDLSFYILNARRGIFRNARLRRAVNFAVNRAALVKLQGAGVGSAADQYLPPAMPGFKDAQIYPLRRPNVRRAKALASGALRNRKVVLYTAPGPLRAAEAQVVKANLARIGLKVEIRQFADLLDRIGAPNEPYDMAWYRFAADYPDPYGMLNVVLDDRPYFKSQRYTGLLRRASRLNGAARYRAYARLDGELARHVAPLLAYMTTNMATLVSRNVDPRCMVLRPGLDLAAVCLKR